jgi:tetratricopeptide (TPR) repeat protein
MKKLFGLCALLSVLVPFAQAGNTQAESELASNTATNYLASGQVDLSIEQFKKAIALDGNNYIAYKGLGLAHAQKGSYKESEAALRKCLEINPDYADARNDLATTLMFLKRPEEARKEWIAADANPFYQRPQAACNLGDSYLSEKNYSEAARWFQRAIQRDDAYGRAHVGLALALLAQSKGDEAIASLEKALVKSPSDIELLFTLGDAYYRAGRFADAKIKLQAVVKEDPVGPFGRRGQEMLKHFPK